MRFSEVRCGGVTLGYGFNVVLLRFKEGSMGF